MGDVGEFWADVKPGMIEESKERRANNRESSAKILEEKGFKFETKNGGAHLIVKRGAMVADFWPGTGKWIIRPSKAPGSWKVGRDGRGVFQLIKAMGGK